MWWDQIMPKGEEPFTPAYLYMFFFLYKLEDGWAQDLKDYARWKQKLIQESLPDLEERMSKFLIKTERMTSNYEKHGPPFILIRTILRAKFHKDHFILNLPIHDNISWCQDVMFIR